MTVLLADPTRVGENTQRRLLALPVPSVRRGALEPDYKVYLDTRRAIVTYKLVLSIKSNPRRWALDQAEIGVTTAAVCGLPAPTASTIPENIRPDHYQQPYQELLCFEDMSRLWRWQILGLLGRFTGMVTLLVSRLDRDEVINSPLHNPEEESR